MRKMNNWKTSISVAQQIVVLVVLLGGAVGGKAQASLTPPVPYEDVGACPFEGCVYREWKARTTVLVRSARRADAPVVFRVLAGENITALTGVVVTRRAGRVRYKAPHRLMTFDGPIDVLPGQTLYLLTYQGEGFSKVWFNGKLYEDVDISDVIDAGCVDAPERCAGRVVEPSRTEWWVQVRNGAGQVGWTREPDKFDGKDALG